MAACILVFRARKDKAHRGKVLFIDAADQVKKGRAQNTLEQVHIDTIFKWYSDNVDVKNHVKVATYEDIKDNGYNLNIPLYVEKEFEDNLPSLEECRTQLRKAVQEARAAEDRFLELLKDFMQ